MERPNWTSARSASCAKPPDELPPRRPAQRANPTDATSWEHPTRVRSYLPPKAFNADSATVRLIFDVRAIYVEASPLFTSAPQHISAWSRPSVTDYGQRSSITGHEYRIPCFHKATPTTVIEEPRRLRTYSPSPLLGTRAPRGGDVQIPAKTAAFMSRDWSNGLPASSSTAR